MAPGSASADCDATLPVDLLLEIVARSDAASVVRCAAAAKPLRCAILDRGFRRLLAQRAIATSGYDPSLLRGVSYKIEYMDADSPPRVVQAVPADEPSVLRFHEGLAFDPVASRDGLVVLRRLRPLFGLVSALRVCHSFTGAVSVLPPVSIRDYHKHALLSVDDNGRAFELLVADEHLRIQIYSSREGRWGPIRAALPRRQSRPFSDSYPLVIGRTVHWLCDRQPWLPDCREPYIVAVDVDTMEATVIDLPRGCTSRMTACMSHRGFLLATASVDGRLKVVVSETQVISMWTMLPPVEGEPRWIRQVLIGKQDWGVHNSVQFEGFGLRSGTVILYVSSVGLIRLNLATKEVVIVYHRSDTPYISQVCLHEMDLCSLLQSMKPMS